MWKSSFIEDVKGFILNKYTIVSNLHVKKYNLKHLIKHSSWKKLKDDQILTFTAFLKQ